MRALRWGTLALALTLAAGAAASGSALGATARITYSDSFTTPVPGQPTGRVLRDLFANVNDPPTAAPYDPSNKKPPAVSHVHTTLPAGTRLDTSAVPQCKASDAELMLQGPSACPESSKLGTNHYIIDEELPPTPDRYVPEEITFFNESHGLILVSKDPTGAYVVVHAIVGTNTIDIELPPFPGTPPDGGANKSDDALFYAATGRRAGRTLGYATTPPTCPTSGKWLFHITYTYRGDGSKQTVEDAMSCFRGPASQAPLRLAFFHRQAARAGSRVRVRVLSSRAAAGTATIAGGGRTLARRKVALHAGTSTLRLPGVPAGSYRFRLSARVPGGKPVSRSARLTVR